MKERPSRRIIIHREKKGENANALWEIAINREITMKKVMKLESMPGLKVFPPDGLFVF